ncbi:FxsA family protein [Candidatus Pelagibacter sp.]|nr:FxsA family protein [Candidatus Pelagibacter sp.]
MNSVLILILSIPLIEIYLFIKIGSSIGAFNTISLILLTAIIGVAYARYEGFNTLRSGMTQLVKNEIPIYEIVSGAALTFAAVLLIIPGFATDFLGLLLIIPVTRKLIFNVFSKRFNKKNNTNEKKDFIEGEYKDMDEK